MLQDLLGTQLDLPVRVAIAAIVIAVLLGLTVLIVRRLSGVGAGSGGRSRQARLAVLDSVALDQRRRLVLVRRDETEHLLLVGGPSDLVVEPGIQRAGRETAAVKDTGRETTSLREPTQRDALPRRPAAPVLSAPPADAAPGRLASPARAELLARPDPFAPSVPSPETAEPVEPPAKLPRANAPVAADGDAEQETPEAKTEAPAAPVEGRRPFSFRRPAAAEVEPASAPPAAPAPRPFTRPAASDRGTRPTTFTSLRTPTALKSAAALGAGATIAGTAGTDTGEVTPKEAAEPDLRSPDVTATPIAPAVAASPRDSDHSAASLGDLPDALPSDVVAPAVQAEEVRVEEVRAEAPLPTPAPEPIPEDVVVAGTEPQSDTVARDNHAVGDQPEVSTAEAEQEIPLAASALAAEPFAEPASLTSNDAPLSPAPVPENGGSLDSPLPESPFSPALEPETKAEAPTVEAQRFEPPVFDLPPPVVDAPEPFVPHESAPVIPAPHVDIPETAPPKADGPSAERVTEPTPIVPPVRREPPVVGEAAPSTELPAVRPAPLFRRVPMFNVTRAPREAASGERTEPQVDDLAKRLESSLEGALGDRAEPKAVPVTPPPAASGAGDARPGLRISPARFSPVMRAGAAPGAPFVPSQRPAPPAPAPAPAPAATDSGLGGSGFSLEQDLVRQLELTLAQEAEEDAKARAATAPPSPAPAAPTAEKAPADPFEDLEAEMATLLGRNLPPRA